VDGINAGLLGLLILITFILCVTMIGATVGSWVRGWKGYSLLPLAVFVLFYWIVDLGTLSLVLSIGSIIASIVMAIKGNKEKSAVICNTSCKSVSGENLLNPYYPNNLAAAYAVPGNFQPATSVVSSTAVYRGSRFLLPDGSSVFLSETTKSIGRSDFEKNVSPNSSNLISRQHFFTKYENGKYYIDDNSSSNGTRVNGIEIKGKGWQELRDGDRIEPAGVMIITYKMGQS
jgi:hypothetical protein